MNFIGLQSFPKQKVSDNEKATKQWKESCVDAVEGLILYNNDTTRQTRYNKQVNYDLYAGKLHPSDIERIVNPTKIKNAYFPAQVRNLPITNPYMKTLVGEELKRRFDFHAKVVNEDAISEKEKAKKQEVFNRLQEMLVATIEQPQSDDPQLQQQYQQEVDKKLESLSEYMNYEWQDIRELSANQILRYFEQYLETKPVFNRGMEDALLAAEEIYCVDVIANNPSLRKCNPLNTYFLLPPDSYKIEDAEMIMEELYMPVSKVLDLYYEYLSPKDIDFLETKSGYRNQSYGGVPSGVLTEPTFNVGSLLGTQAHTVPGTNANNSRLPFDYQNNVRVVKVVWRSMRKIGKLSYFDESGNPIEEYVDGSYKPDINLGETIEWQWIGEWWEGTKIANEIYIKIQPRPIQFRSISNISECRSGYVGSVYKTNSSQAQSLFDMMKPYQYMYILLMHKMEQLTIKNKGKIGSLDLARVPDGWDPDKWLYYAEHLGWAVEDSFKEAKKGAATGKVVGNMSGHAPIMDLEMSNYIQAHIAQMQYIESQLDKITGINPERRGAFSSSERGLGVTVEAKQASATITEWYFMMHDDVKRRVMEMILETAKYCLRNGSKKFQYINDDTTQTIFTIDGELLNEAEYGLFVRSASEDAETIGVLKRAVEAGFQSGQIDILQMLDVYSNNSLASIRRKVEKAVSDKNQQAEQARQEENQIKQNQIEQAAQTAREQMELTKYKIDADNQTKIQVAEIQVFSRQEELDTDNNGIPDPLEVGALALKQQEANSKQFTEQQKHDRETRKQEIDKANKEKELALKEKELKSKEYIAELQSKTALQVAKENKTKAELSKNRK